MSDAFSNLVSLSEVRRWEEECARIDQQIAELTAKRQKFGQLIELAKEFAEPTAPSREIQPLALTGDKSASPPRLAKGGRRRREDTWKHAIEVIVKAHPEGISYEKIKELVPERLKKQLEHFPAGKGLYTALKKLEDAKVIVRKNGVAFTQKGYVDYKKKVAAGEAEDISNKRRGSPIEDAIKQFLRDHGPSKGAEIRAHLIRFEEFGPAVLRNSSAMYNVLLRLKGRGEVWHDEDASTYSLAQDNGALHSDAASAPKVKGGAATLPFENVVGFPRSR